ncbi:MAG: hypothetical protein ACXVV5_27135 [Solirubrobacteraceae bacterium]
MTLVRAIGCVRLAIVVAGVGRREGGAREPPDAAWATALVVWLGFELGIAPVLGLSQTKRPRPVDRLALAADHLLYGLVLAGTRRGARS